MALINRQISFESISPFFTRSQGAFTISGIPIDQIMAVAGTASAYIYDANTIRDNYRSLRAHLPDRIDIYYAIKANPNIAVVDLLISEGSGVDIASAGELLICKRLEANPQKIAFTGPVKTGTESGDAIAAGAYVNAESLSEVASLGELSTSLDHPLNIGLRINPPFHIECTRMHLSGGGPSKFGIDLAQVPHVLESARHFQNLRINGLHFSIASGVLSAEALLGYYAACFRTADDLSALIKLDRIDMGGGLGIPFLPGEEPLDTLRLGEGLQEILDAFPSLREAEVILEPGRFLVGRSGIYVSTVQHVKTSHEQDIIMVDGGAHQLSGPAMRGSFNPTYNLSRHGLPRVFDIAGETCTAAGYIGKQLLLTPPEPGDYIGVFNSGGYGYTQSLMNFISHGAPPEILIDNGQIHIIREAKSVESHLEGQHLPGR